MSSKNIYIPSKKQISEMIWHEYVYENDHDDLKYCGGWLKENEDFKLMPHNHYHGWDDEVKKRISETLKNRTLPEQHKKNIKEGMRGKMVHRRRPIIIDGIEYASVVVAAEAMGICPASVLYRIKSKNFDYAYK
jgi:hypothetical protein